MSVAHKLGGTAKRGNRHMEPLSQRWEELGVEEGLTVIIRRRATAIEILAYNGVLERL